MLQAYINYYCPYSFFSLNLLKPLMSSCSCSRTYHLSQYITTGMIHQKISKSFYFTRLHQSLLLFVFSILSFYHFLLEYYSIEITNTSNSLSSTLWSKSIITSVLVLLILILIFYYVKYLLSLFSYSKVLWLKSS